MKKYGKIVREKIEEQKIREINTRKKVRKKNMVKKYGPILRTILLKCDFVRAHLLLRKICILYADCNLTVKPLVGQ